MVSFDILYSQFLSSISSITLSSLTDEEVKAELFNLAQRAMVKFRYPKIALTYSFNTDEQMYYFDNNVTQKELNIILAHMLVEWISFQISNEEKFKNQYYDKNVSTFSMGNLLAQLNRMYENFSKKAKDEEYNYYRVDIDGTPRIGKING